MIPQTIILAKDRSNADRACAFLQSLPADKPFKVTVEDHKARRSDAQNNYWWAVPVKLLSDATGYESEEIHQYLLGTFYGWKDKLVPKTPHNPEGLASVPIRTTTRDADGKRSVLTKLEFMDLVAFAQRFAASKGVYVPDPDQQAAA
jgi:hypothetical protein